MNLLLDTHIFLWWLQDSKKLSISVKSKIADASNLIHLSSVSVWEMRIKQRLGKLDIPDNFRAIITSDDFIALPLTHAHAENVYSLENHHNDPFDRMLISQAQVEELTLVTADTKILRYDIKTLGNY